MNKRWCTGHLCIYTLYSVRQSDRNSFCGDVVLDIFNMAYRDEGLILYKKYEKWIFWDLYYKVFLFKTNWRKCIKKGNTAHNINKELIKLCFSATVVLVSIFVKCYKELIVIMSRTYMLLYIWSKVFSLFRDTMPFWCWSRRHLRKNCSHLIASHCTCLCIFLWWWLFSTLLSTIENIFFLSGHTSLL